MMMEVVVTTGAISRANSSQIITTNKPTSSFFYRPDVLPVARPTASKHWRENITFHVLVKYCKYIEMFGYFTEAFNW